MCATELRAEPDTLPHKDNGRERGKKESLRKRRGESEKDRGRRRIAGHGIRRYEVKLKQT
jgi:hypothetical protein